MSNIVQSRDIAILDFLMKRVSKIYLILLALFFCLQGLPQTISANSATNSASANTITIIQTTDIHSAILPDKNTPGFLKLATKIRREIKNAGGKDSCLLIDCGDTIQGSLIGSISKGSAGIIALNALEYDARIPGNHELDFGTKRLEELFQITKPAILCLNITPKIHTPVQGWKMFIKNGFKIAVIGITYEYPANPETQKEKINESTSAKLAKIIPEIMNAMPDLIVLGIHNGISKPSVPDIDTLKIANTYPQINLILGGHTHQEVPGQIVGIGSWYVQAGDHAKCAAVVKVEFEKSSKQPPTISSKLIFAEESDMEDAKCAEALANYIEETKREGNKIVGELKEKIFFDNSKTPISSLFTAAVLLDATNADIAFSATQTESASLEGVVTKKDIFDFSPYEDTICALDLTPCEIRKILLEQKQIKEKSQRLIPYPIIVKFSKDGTIKLLDKRGNPLVEDKTYRVAFTNYALSGAGGKYPQLKKISEAPENNRCNTNIPLQQAISNYITKNSPLAFPK